MTLKYLIRERLRGLENSAGVKARDDIEDILIGMADYVPLDYVTEAGKSGSAMALIKAHRERYKILKGVVSSLKPGDELVIQFPMFGDSIFAVRLFKKLTSSGVKVRFIVHDLEMFRDIMRKDVPLKKRIKMAVEEKNVLKSADRVIVHNVRMLEKLREAGIPADIMATINIFDYLIPDYDANAGEIQKNIGYGKPVIIAGNLMREKAGYVYKLPSDVEFNLYGISYEGEQGENEHYHGVFAPDELPFKIEGSFGLVWDGTSADTCAGVFGEYLKVNNPHKTSLYIAAGIPVIIWSEAALAGFIEEHNCGLTVNSLNDIAARLAALSEEEYAAMLKGAKETGEALRKGCNIKNSLAD